MPIRVPPPDPDPGRCAICKVSLDRREGPLYEIARLRAALRAISTAYVSDGNTKRQREAFALVRSIVAETDQP